MKYLIFFLFPISLFSQSEFSVIITSESGDSTFQIDEVTQTGDRFAIDRTVGVDTATLQLRQYTLINRNYERIARLQAEILDATRDNNALRQTLTGLGLNDYTVWQRSRLDSTYAGNWKYTFQGSTIDVICTVNVNNVSRFYRTSDNQEMFLIVPFSRNNLRLNPSNGWGNGDPFLNVTSSDGKVFICKDRSEERHLFRKK